MHPIPGQPTTVVDEQWQEPGEAVFCCCASVNLLESNFCLCHKYAILFILIVVKKDGFVSTAQIQPTDFECFFPSKMLNKLEKELIWYMGYNTIQEQTF